MWQPWRGTVQGRTEVVACNPKSSTNVWNHSTTGEFVPAGTRQGPKSRPVLGYGVGLEILVQRLAVIVPRCEDLGTPLCAAVPCLSQRDMSASLCAPLRKK